VAPQDDWPIKIGELPLPAFELPKWLVEPAVRSCRLFNTALDFIFYDVPTLRAAPDVSKPEKSVVTTDELSAFGPTLTILGRRLLSLGSCEAFALKSERAVTKRAVFAGTLL
jgi:hypothetical protein